MYRYIINMTKIRKEWLYLIIIKKTTGTQHNVHLLLPTYFSLTASQRNIFLTRVIRLYTLQLQSSYLKCFFNRVIFFPKGLMKVTWLNFHIVTFIVMLNVHKTNFYEKPKVHEEYLDIKKITFYNMCTGKLHVNNNHF